MKEKDKRATGTLRLILAALKDRDIAVRGKDASRDRIDENEILQMLQTMIKQRRDSIELYEKGGRPELAQQEAEEITIIERFLPEQIAGPALEAAVGEVIAEVGAAGIKDMGRTMAALRDRYAGQMDFAQAGAMVKERLA